MTTDLRKSNMRPQLIAIVLTLTVVVVFQLTVFAAGEPVEDEYLPPRVVVGAGQAGVRAWFWFCFLCVVYVS